MRYGEILIKDKEISSTKIEEKIDDDILLKSKSPKLFYFLIQAFLSFGENLGYQYLPIFTRRLGASEIQMGLLTAVNNVAKTIFQPTFGKMSDKYGRKIFMLTGAMIATASAITITFASSVVQVIISVTFNAFGLSILFPAWQGAIADYTEGSKRGGFMGRILGVSYIYISVSLMTYVFIVPLLGFNEINQFRLIIGMAGLNFGLVSIMSWLFIDLREKSFDISQDSIFMPLKDKNYRTFLKVILFWWFFMSLAWSYFPLVISDVIMASPVEVSYIAISATIIQASASYFLADYIDKFGEKISISIGFLSFTAVPLTFAFASEWWHLIPAQMISGIGIGFGFTALRSYIIEIGGADRAGNYQGVYQLLWGLTTFSGSFLGGVILDLVITFVGDISTALTYMLLIIAGLRFSSNIVIFKYLPNPISSLK